MESPEKPDLVDNGYKLVSSDNEEARTCYHYASDELGSITHIVKAAVYKKLEEDRQMRLRKTKTAKSCQAGKNESS